MYLTYRDAQYNQYMYKPLKQAVRREGALSRKELQVQRKPKVGQTDRGDGA